MHLHVHSSIVHSRIKTGNQPMSIDRRQDKEDVVQTDNEILLSHEWSSKAFAATWVQLEIITLSDVRQTPTRMISLSVESNCRPVKEPVWNTEMHRPRGARPQGCPGAGVGRRMEWGGQSAGVSGYWEREPAKSYGWHWELHSVSCDEP